MWKRKAVWAAVLILVICTAAAYLWYFRTSEHARALSPDGRWTAIITKRQQSFPEPVEIRLQIVENGGSQRVWLDTDVDEPDLWDDVKPDSYEIRWQNAEEFLLGWRSKEEGFILHGRLRGDRWVLDPVEGPRQ